MSDRECIKDYLGALNVDSIDNIKKYEDGIWFAQSKEDGIFVRIIMTKAGNRITSRWGEEITEGSVEDGLTKVITGVEGTFVGELEASTEFSTAISRKRGYRMIHLFNVLELNGKDCRTMREDSRLDILYEIYNNFTEEGKKRFDISKTSFYDFKRLYEEAHEGIMLKRRDNLYDCHRKSRKTEYYVKVKKWIAQSMVFCGHAYTKIGNEVTGRWGLFNGKEIVPVLTAGFDGLTEQNKDTFLGKVADLKGFEVTKKGSLRSGQFMDWRDDLVKEQCLFGQEVRKL